MKNDKQPKKRAKKSTSRKKGPGRPSKYKAEYAEQAYKLCLLRATDEELAGFFNVNVDTIYEWKKRHKEFSESVTRGKMVADGEVANSFYNRAVGYSYDEVTYEKVDGEALLVTETSMIAVDQYKKKVVRKHLPPDPGAALNWLKNRQPDKWRDKQDHEHTGKDGKDLIPIPKEVDLSRLSDEQIRQMAAIQKILDGGSA